MTTVTLATILHPTDFSKNSRVALDWALTWAQQFGARLIVLHVVPEFAAVYQLAPEEVERLSTHMQQIAEAEVRRLWQERGGAVDYELVVTIGAPAQEIVRVATERQVDLVVIGTHGRTGLAHALLGSVADQVVRLAPCPVLTVRSSPEQ
jgi:nucleotide-binding universal stress UspA family protein